MEVSGVLMDASSSPIECSGLLDLPTEIRIEIYRHLFAAAQLSLEGGHPDSWHCGSSICLCAFPYHLVNTCRQLRHEAAPYLLGATTLQVKHSLENVDRLPPRYVSEITRAVMLNVGSFSKSPMQLGSFLALKTVELRNITVWCKYHDEAYLESHEGDDCMIGLALFNLGRISPHFTQLCADTTRSFKILLCCQYVVSSMTDETIVRNPSLLSLC